MRRKACSRVDADGDDARRQGRNAHAQRQRQTEIQKHDLHDERRAAYQLDIPHGNGPQDAVASRVDQPRRHAESQPQGQTAHRDEQGHFQTLHQQRQRFDNDFGTEVKSHAHRL